MYACLNILQSMTSDQLNRIGMALLCFVFLAKFLTADAGWPASRSASESDYQSLNSYVFPNHLPAAALTVPSNAENMLPDHSQPILEESCITDGQERPIVGDVSGATQINARPEIAAIAVTADMLKVAGINHTSFVIEASLDERGFQS